MTQGNESGHLSPEIFVDVVEGVPVEVGWQQHLAACSRCRAELAELEQTMALLSADATDARGSIPPPPASPVATRAFPAWVVPAAAVLLAAVGAVWFVGDMGTSAPVSVENEELLPPVDQDAEFQLLLAVSDATDDELGEIATSAFDEFELDPAPMTPGERQRFVERLTEEMRSSL